MSIAKKLVLMVGVGLAALIFVSALSWYSLYAIEAGYKEVFRTDYRQVELALMALDNMGESVQAYKNCLIRNSPRYADEFNKHNAVIQANLKEYITISDDNERKLAEQAIRIHDAYCGSIAEVIKARQSNSDIAWVDQNISQGIDKPVRAALDSLAETSRKNIESTRQELQKWAQKKLYMQFAGAAGAGGFLILFGATLGSGIKRRIDTFSDVMAKVAENDLNVQVNVASHDEIGQLERSFQYMLNSMRQLTGTLSKSSSQLSECSNVMQSNAQQMATGADDAAAQAIVVATAGEEMSATAGDIAQNCNFAAESAKRASDAAIHGATVVENSISVMQRIAQRVHASATTVEDLGKRSDQIGSIINTIEDIADQTNLLALNAAIEAARAGDQGRGFAVVADEVRSLAERTARATQEIAGMIKAIQQETRSAVAAMEEGVAEVEQGTREAARSGEALRLIQDEINTVNLQVQQIATAAEEQTATTSEISGNIHHITDVVRDTAEGARTTLSIAQDLSRLSNELKLVVSQFNATESGKLIDWSDIYSVGVASMDEEHQRLVGIINNLNNAMHSGNGRGAIGAILDELITYTKNHFSHEERLMRETGYPGYDEQKRAHDALVNRVMEAQASYRAGTALSQEVMGFLINWLVNHIQGMDKRYGAHLVKNGAR